jgi:hypothetical protein
MNFRSIALVFSGVLLTACNQISAGLTPAHEKINAAFPIEDSIKIAHAALLAAMEGKHAEQKTISDQYAKLIGVRAITCTAKSSIDRFDTLQNIKLKVLDVECFQKQDALLAEWIGLQRLALALSRPALVPLSTLPDKSLLPNYSDYSGQVTAAADANVLVVKGTQKLTAVSLPSGKVINAFGLPEQAFKPVTLSPNGHVLAVPTGSRNLRMYEVETGKQLWNTEGYADVIAWLPQVQAALLTQVNTGSPQLLDIKNGKIEAFPSTEKRLTWALQDKAASGKYLVGAGQTVSQMEIKRTEQGVLEAAPIAQWRLNGAGISSTNAFLVADGTKLVYQSGQDLAWINLDNQQQGLWQLSAINAYGFTKLNEKSIIFETNAVGPTAAATRMLDISTGTVSAAKNMDLRDGSMVSLLPRAGYIKRSETSVTIGTMVETDTPQNLDQLVSDALLAKQLAKLTPSANSMGEADTPRNSYHEALASQVRAMNAAGAIKDGLPRDVVESIRRGSTNSSNNNPPTVGSALLSDVPSNARVSVVGVYEGTSAGSGSKISHSTGSVRINVQPGSAPLVLVLSNYEPVHWLINTNGRKISKILTSGYNEATVMGANGTTVVKIGNKHAYKIDSNDYSSLKRDIARYVANPIGVFQGSYTGREFSVN